MSSSASVWLLLIVGFVCANLPFLSDRMLLVGPRRPSKGLAWRLVELLLMAALTVLLGMLVEARSGQRHPQAWPFYAAVLCLFLTFAFPGFVWRHLRRQGGGQT